MNKLYTETFYFSDNGHIPNNSLPLVLYRRSLEGRIDSCIKLFKQNKWSNSWENGVFPYHHYHSNTHEVLGVISGSASITFGGENGESVKVEKGDVVVIPAGVGHKKEQSSADFKVVGAYPNGMSHDLKTGEAEERPEVIENIQNVPLPSTDPLQGQNGHLVVLWSDLN
ncbi:cupin domain-containing protein [Guptibacillus hwajinpoensis]|uniref:Cupin type-1 domain-containing protein n=1 Tax=Guptibacillus hwajinpoensis TaxID=208199 RepID=A0A0J6CRW1_9BACL|nr:cupin domain-containing protein [Alkalihalobacillus macyae]KMM39041.1 hypothetical protein AB986_07345 [Alkalihalobacillus macyae]